MFGFFLSKKNIFSYSILIGCYFFCYFFLINYLGIGNISTIFLMLISILHLFYFHQNTQNNNNLYREFIYCTSILVCINSKITTTEIGTIFSIGILWYLICLNKIRDISFYFTLGLFTGICLISDFLFSSIVLTIFFILILSIFNLNRLINFILGILTSFCLLWIGLFFIGKTELLTHFFSININHILLKKDLSVILFKTILFLPILLTVLYIIFYCIKRNFTFQDNDIKKTPLIVAMLIAIVIGVVFAGNSTYFNFVLCFPISYLIGNYLTINNTSTNAIVREFILGIVVLSGFLYFVSEHFTIFDYIKKYTFF